MNILFLGTSSGWPLPRLGCKCDICASQDQKDRRLRPSLLINKSILIDASPDIYHQFEKYNIDPTEITHILITHAHHDHISGLYDLSHIYNVRRKIELIASQGTMNALRRKMGPSLFRFRNREIKPFEKNQIGSNLYFWFVPVIHTIEAYAIKIKQSRPFVYAPEFRKILPSSKKYLGNIDLAIIDGSSKTFRGQAKGHETIEEGLRLGKELAAKKVLFTNIGHITDGHEALVNFVKENGSHKFGIAFDGLEIKV